VFRRRIKVLVTLVSRGQSELLKTYYGVDDPLLQRSAYVIHTKSNSRVWKMKETAITM